MVEICLYMLGIGGEGVHKGFGMALEFQLVFHHRLRAEGAFQIMVEVTAVSEAVTVLIFDTKHNYPAWKSRRFPLVRTHAFSGLLRVVIVSIKHALEQQRLSIA